MNIPLILITYTAALSLIVMITYVLRHEGLFSGLHKIYYVGALFTLPWCLSYFVMYFTADPALAAAAYRAGSIGWTVNFSIMFLLCAKLFEIISGKKIPSFLRYVTVLISLVFFAAALKGKIFATDFIRVPGGWWAEHVRMESPWLIAYLVWTIALFMTALIPLFPMVKRAKLKRHRRQLFFIFTPFLCVTFLAIVINLIGPITGGECPPLGHIFLSFYLTFVGYVIVKFRVTSPDLEFITDPLLFQISDMVILTDGCGKILRINNATSGILGHKTDTLVSKELTTILPDLMPLEQGVFERDAVMDCGKLLPVHCTITPIDDIHGDRIGFFLLLKDLTALKKLEELTKVLQISNQELEQLSVTDSLTGMFNRSKLRSVLTQEILRSRRYGSVFSLILYDVDHFKRINDSYGHTVGDTVLRTMADTVRMSIRETDILCRWGGEEFFIVCVNTDQEAAGNLAEKIRLRLAELNHEGIGTVTASFGVTTFRESDTEDSIIDRTDRAMYDAKRRGRNVTSIF